MMKFFFFQFFFLKINISGAIHKEYLIYKCVSDVVRSADVEDCQPRNGKKGISYLVLYNMIIYPPTSEPSACVTKNYIYFKFSSKS